MHFLVKLERAAPESFFSVADASHVALESFSHFITKLFSAAPASFLSAACDLHDAVCAAAGRIPSIRIAQMVTVLMRSPLGVTQRLEPYLLPRVRQQREASG